MVFVVKLDWTDYSSFGLVLPGALSEVLGNVFWQESVSQAAGMNRFFERKRVHISAMFRLVSVEIDYKLPVLVLMRF
jgi:hypothetical protein